MTSRKSVTIKEQIHELEQVGNKAKQASDKRHEWIDAATDELTTLYAAQDITESRLDEFIIKMDDYAHAK